VTRVTLEGLLGYSFEGCNIAVIGCGDRRVRGAIDRITPSSGASWDFFFSRPGGTLVLTGEIPKINPAVALESLLTEYNHVQDELMDGASAEGRDPEEVKLSAIFDFRHFWCAANHFHIGDIPFDDQLAQTRVSQNLAVPILRRHIPGAAIFQMIYDYKTNTWH
jgi:hypothetical protein